MAITVETRYGRIRGSIDRGVHVFRGIPFARPPIGEARFEPPQRPEAWSGIRNAVQFGPAAPQVSSPSAAIFGQQDQHQSEDCLHLNVWTPSTEGIPRPVLVWIHGGGFEEGTSALPDYCGQRLARRGDLVVVTLQYRLGVLGFLHIADSSDGRSNLGLQDQIAALEWVQDEIDAFGGDPGQVTLCGAGSGATSIATLMGMPAARKLFSRAILQSGRYQIQHSDEAHDNASRLFRELDLLPGDRTKLKAVPLAALLRAQEKTRLDTSGLTGSRPFQLTLDGECVTSPPLSAIRNGEARDIPVIVGSTRDEQKLAGLLDPTLQELDVASLRIRLEAHLPAPQVERAIEVYTQALYPAETPVPSELYFAIESDRLYRYGTTRLAELQSSHQSRTYTYLFRWSSTPELGAPELGAFHGIDRPFTFGTLEDHSLRHWIGKSPATTLLARNLQDAWAHFARTSDPSHAGIGRWPRFEAKTRKTMILDAACEVSQAPMEAERRFWLELVSAAQ